MKRFRYTLLLIVLISGCDSNQPALITPVLVEKGSVSFSVGRDERPGGGRLQTDTSPAFVNFALRKADGGIITETLELFDFSEGGLVTVPLQLDVGTYKLETFTILDGEHNAIHAAPADGTPMAHLVEDPLPITVNVTPGEITLVTPEVLEVDELNLHITTTTAVAANSDPSDYTLEAVAKDAALGAVLWTKTFNMTSSNRHLSLPGRFGHYTLTAKKDGFIDHTQHYTGTEIRATTSLAFEFIPQSLEGFVKHELLGGKATLYFPNDKNRCKLYARVDIAEGQRIIFDMMHKSATTLSGTALAFVRSCDKCEPNMINVYGNRPFVLAEDYCATLKLPGSMTWDKVVISTSVFVRDEGLKMDAVSINSKLVE